MPVADRDAIMVALDTLTRDPFNRTLDTETLKNHLFGWRMRVRAYRVLYNLDPLARIVDVGEIARRSSTTYRKARR